MKKSVKSVDFYFSTSAHSAFHSHSKAFKHDMLVILTSQEGRRPFRLQLASNDDNNLGFKGLKSDPIVA